MTHRFWRHCAAPATLSLGLLLGGCSTEDPQAMVASARQYLEQNDHPAAIIQLKNALQAQPDLAEARFLLGRALLLKGDPAGAQTELQKARALGHSADEVTPLLVRSRLALGQFREVTEEFAQVRLTPPWRRPSCTPSWRWPGASGVMCRRSSPACRRPWPHSPVTPVPWLNRPDTGRRARISQAPCSCSTVC
jgi:tetratricopeptide (TPR) repeat protein